MATCRVLIVDDFEPFRRAVRLMLKVRDDLQIVGEASDGVEAVQRAQSLRPDLIVLDVGLPGLNGIEVTRWLRDLVPSAKVLFLSVDSSPETIREALSAGAAGYVSKLHTASDLLPAIDSVLGGGQFISRKLSPSTTGEKGDEQSDNEKPPAKFRREVSFYADDAAFVDGFARYIAANLNDGNVALVLLVTASHGRGILRRLQEQGLEMAIREGRYISLDAGEAFSKFMVDGWPDTVRLKKAVGDLMERANTVPKASYCRVVACGELAPTLLKRGNMLAAIQLEQLWDEIARSHGLDTLCGYLLSDFPGGTQNEVFKSICAEHSSVNLG